MRNVVPQFWDQLYFYVRSKDHTIHSKGFLDFHILNGLPENIVNILF
jgi:hypothetical protein